MLHMPYAEYVRKEAAAAERAVAAARLAIFATLFAAYLLIEAPTRGHVLGTVVVPVMLALGYAAAVLWWLRRAYHPAVALITTAIDIVFVTATVHVAFWQVGSWEQATKVPIAPVYAILIAAAGVRLSPGVALFATLASTVAYVSLFVPVLLLEPQAIVIGTIQDWDRPFVSPLRVAFSLIALGLTGLIVALAAGHARSAVARSLHTVTFLYADLRRYTAFVEQHGDAAGAEVVAAYRDLVRGEVARLGGREVKTEGDSFLVEFASAAQAIACACAILRSAESRSTRRPDRPLPVGIGVHAGEPARLEGDYVGSAVNIAARLGQLAEEGELLVSDIVRGLLRTSGLPSARERQAVALKGVADPPRVFALDWRAVSPPLR